MSFKWFYSLGLLSIQPCPVVGKGKKKEVCGHPWLGKWGQYLFHFVVFRDFCPDSQSPLPKLGISTSTPLAREIGSGMGIWKNSGHWILTRFRILMNGTSWGEKLTFLTGPENERMYFSDCQVLLLLLMKQELKPTLAESRAKKWGETESWEFPLSPKSSSA